MSETSESEFSKMWRPASDDRLDKLGVSLGAVSSTGFDVRTFPASTWLIHAMYEREMDSPLSHDEREKQQIADRQLSPVVVNNSDLSAATKETGVRSGWGAAPGGSYQRLRWRD